MKKSGRFIRRLVCALLAFCCMVRLFALPARAEYNAETPEYLLEEDLTATSAILIEADSGEVIFEKNADRVMYPASTTKILTVYLALLLYGDRLDEKFIVSASAMDIPSDSSTIPLSIGEEVSLRDVLNATMIRSGNDGANVIAEAVGGTIPQFVQMMNQTAKSLGCTSTHFNNAHGYHDENHYTTARDMAIIAREAMTNEYFRQIVNQSGYRMPADNIYSKARNLTSTNYMLINSADSETYYPYCIGIKTGHHSAAGYCFVGAAEKDGVTLISVVFHSSSEKASFTDTTKLMEYGFSQFTSVSIADIYALNPKTVDISYYSADDSNLGKLPLALKKVSSEGSDAIVTSKSNITYLSQHLSEITTCEFTREFEAPIEAGETMGTLTYYNANKEATVYELVATRSIARRERVAPTVEEIIAYTEADPNPFPRFTLEFAAIYIALPIFCIILLIRLLVRLLSKKKGKSKKKKIKPKQTQTYYR